MSNNNLSICSEEFRKEMTEEMAILKDGIHYFKKNISNIFIDACKDGNTSLLLVLLDQGVDIESKSLNGNTGLMWAAKVSSSTSSTSLP